MDGSGGGATTASTLHGTDSYGGPLSSSSSSPSTYGYSPHHFQVCMYVHIHMFGTDDRGSPRNIPCTPLHFTRQFAASSSGASLTQTTHAPHESTGASLGGAASPSLGYAFDEGLARMLKQQNDLILQR